MDLDSFVNVENGDPVADFIAREQNVLAEIEGDLDFTDDLTHLSQEITTESETIIQNGENLINSNGDNLFSEENEVPSTFVDTENNKTESVFDNLPVVENEKITRWRSQSVKLLNERDEEEAKRIQELIEQAKQELQDWYSQYNDQLNRLKESNRQAEADWVAERDAAVPGKEWEKVARMCDFNPKPNQKNVKDTSRMKSILLQLKQHPPKESTPSA
ncbi:clathrin light chain-like [Panonychus citri]|uniref:clathrin light chain-like n=1 Tax=Panonychus citri TaxID=50023 RepID=UPI00230770E5|nr:clathrin light chain-like [Panonychus citri]